MVTDIRERTEEVIRESSEEEQPVLVEAPPASGKTYSAVRLAQEPDQQVLYLAGRKDLYQQAIEEAIDAGGIYFEKVPNPYRDCKTFKDENKGDTKRAQRMYARGKRGIEIHYADRDTVYTPCMGGDGCEYIRKLDNIDPESEEIDLLIGNHQHAYVPDYLDGRIVIFDEFNAEPFVTRFPSADSMIYDSPHEVIKPVLQASEVLPYDDFTDLIETRARTGQTTEQDLERVTKEIAEAVQNSIDVSPSKYDTTHSKSAFITCALLCMEKVGAGMEFAHEPDRWEQLDENRLQRCVRNRDSGQMAILDSPPLDEAAQVIGLDALPVKRLWETVFSCEFNRKQVIPREDLGEYLEESLNIEVFQVANGKNHYSSGQLSRRDKQRFVVIRALEGETFPVISRKQALSAYLSHEWFSHCVEDAEDGADSDLRARQYAKVLSSNVFGEDSLGLVSGSPFPGDAIVKRWTALCGESTTPIRSAEGPSTGQSLVGFEGFGDEIYHHFTHHQVAQAIFRFGRETAEGEQSTVYVNTTAVPDWLPATELNINDIHSTSKRTQVLESLIRATVSRNPPEGKTTKQLRNAANSRLDDEEITRERVRQVLRTEVQDCVRIEQNAGENGADLFFWDSEDNILPLPVTTSFADHLVKVDSTIHLLKLA